jgi:subtilase family serine protease
LSRFGALWTGVAIACFWMLASCATASAAPGQIRVGKAPRRPAGARLVGALAGATRLPVSVTLKPRDPAGLAAHAAAVSTPGSADYRHYLSVAGFSRRFGPPPGQIAAIRSSLRAHGLRPGHVSANGLSIPVTATARAIERSFSTSLQRIALPGGRTAFTNTQAPLFDRAVAGAVQGVVGLDSLSAPQPLSLRRAAAAAQPSLPAHVGTGGPQPCASATTASQTGDATTYTADQIASAYGFSGLYGAGDEGAGQTIAVYELESNIPSDITAYQQCYGTNASVSYVSVDGGPGHSHSGEGMETELDVESVIGLAPKANVVVYQGPNSSSNLPGSGPYDTYNAIISQDQANIVSTSWGACEADIGSASAQAEDTLFQEAAVQGQTILAATGDDGSEGCSTHDSLAVDDPGSQPFVTSAGGTSLSLSPSRSETVWNDRQGAGGGGISSLWPMPSYQSSAPAWLNVAASSS